MAAVALHLDEGDVGGGRVQRLDHRLALGRGEQPVGGEGHDAEAGRRMQEGARQRAAEIRRQVEIVHRPGDIEIGIGVEPVDEGHALVAQVALDLEIGVEAEGDRLAVLQVAAELAVQRRVGEIGDVGGHARHRQPLGGAHAALEIAPAAPVGIGHHRLAADLVEGDVLRGMAGGGGDRHGGEHPLGIAHRPLQHLHAAHRAADHGKQRLDAEMVEQHRLGADHVADRHQRQVEAPAPAGRRIGRGRSGGAEAAAEHIGADYEEAVGVDRPAGADEQRPPAGLAGQRVARGDILVAGQGVADENGVAAVLVQRAIGLVGDLPGIEHGAAIELQGPVAAELLDAARRRVSLAGGRGPQLRRALVQWALFGGRVLAHLRRTSS